MASHLQGSQRGNGPSPKVEHAALIENLCYDFRVLHLITQWFTLCKSVQEMSLLHLSIYCNSLLLHAPPLVFAPSHQCFPQSTVLLLVYSKEHRSFRIAAVSSPQRVSIISSNSDSLGFTAVSGVAWERCGLNEVLFAIPAIFSKRLQNSQTRKHNGSGNCLKKTFKQHSSSCTCTGSFFLLN